MDKKLSTKGNIWCGSVALPIKSPIETIKSGLKKKWTCRLMEQANKHHAKL